MKKNISSQSIGAEMITVADGSNFTGTVTVLITKDNGTQSASAGTAPAHEGNGYHSYSPTQTETDADHIAFTFTGTGAITATVQVFTSFPQTADHTAAIADIPTNSEFNARTILSANYSTAANLATVDTNVDAILVDTSTTIPAQISALNDIAAADVWSVVTRELTSGANIALAKGIGLTGLNDIAAIDVLNAGDVDGFTLEESQKLILAASVGVLAGAATTTVTIEAADGSKDRITATVDSDGNRSLVVKDATG